MAVTIDTVKAWNAAAEALKLRADNLGEEAVKAVRAGEQDRAVELLEEMHGVLDDLYQNLGYVLARPGSK